MTRQSAAPAAPAHRGVPPAASRHGALALLGLALAMEVVLAVGWLRPLSLWRHQVNPPAGAPMVTILGRTRDGALQFVVPAVLLCALYALAVWTAARARGRLATVVVLGAPLLFAATLVPMFPGGTQDIFHNVADGRLLWHYGDNPTLVPPSAHPQDAFYPHLYGYNDLTSAYGPLWYALAGAPVAVAGDGLVANVVAQKVMMSLFFVATVVLVWASARWWSRDDADDSRMEGPAAGVGRGRAAWPSATTAAVVVGWCPLLLWEAAGNGHNDAIMVFFAAAAIAAALRRWWLWVFPLLALSALVKFTTLLLGPVLLVWLLRRPDVPRRRIAAGLGIAALIVVAAYVPFWAGPDTLNVLRRPGMTFILSPATLLDGALRGALSETVAMRLTYVATGAAFVLLYLGVLWRMRGDPAHLLGGGFDGLFMYLVLASWWFWPWYLGWLAPLAGWLAGGRRTWLFVLMSSAALLTYCYWWSDPPERSRLWFTWYGLLTVAVFAVPFGLWLSAHRCQRIPRTG